MVLDPTAQTVEIRKEAIHVHERSSRYSVVAPGETLQSEAIVGTFLNFLSAQLILLEIWFSWGFVHHTINSETLQSFQLVAPVYCKREARSTKDQLRNITQAACKRFCLTSLISSVGRYFSKYRSCGVFQRYGLSEPHGQLQFFYAITSLIFRGFTLQCNERLDHQTLDVPHRQSGLVIYVVSHSRDCRNQTARDLLTANPTTSSVIKFRMGLGSVWDIWQGSNLKQFKDKICFMICTLECFKKSLLQRSFIDYPTCNEFTSEALRRITTMSGLADLLLE